jgi:hypothetical protein
MEGRYLLVGLALALSGCATAVVATPRATSLPTPAGSSIRPTDAPTPTPVSTAAPTAKPTPKPVPVVVCRLPMTVGQDGNAYPLFFAPLDPRILSLRSDASYSLFQAAFCGDWANSSGTLPIEISGVELATTAHGWRFSVASVENDTATWMYVSPC